MVSAAFNSEHFPEHNFLLCLGSAEAVAVAVGAAEAARGRRKGAGDGDAATDGVDCLPTAR